MSGGGAGNEIGSDREAVLPRLAFEGRQGEDTVAEDRR